MTVVGAQIIHERLPIESFEPGVLSTGKAWQSQFLVLLELGQKKKYSA